MACFCHKCTILMPNDSFERKGNNIDRNAIWKTKNWLKIVEAFIMKTSFRAVTSAACESAVCLHRNFAT